MRIISRKALKDFSALHSDAKQALETWFRDVSSAQWQNPADVTAVYRTASILDARRVVFNIKGNSYRLVVAIDYPHKLVFIRFVGTHAEYDHIDATSV